MPRTPRGHKRPADPVANAVVVMKIATGEIEENSDPTSDAAAVLGRKGGAARAAALSQSKRRSIAKKAAAARWKTR
jgi:hypothetical protein